MSATARAPIPATPARRAPDVALVVAAATAPGTFTASLSPRSALDQGLVTGLATGLQHVLSVSSQEILESLGRFVVDGSGGRLTASGGPARMAAVDCAAVPLGLAIVRALPPRPGEPMLRGVARQMGWRFAATGFSGALLIGAQAGVRRVDDRLGLGGRLASVPLAVPVGLTVSFVLERRQGRAGEVPPDAPPRPGPVRSLAIAGGVVGGLSAAAYGEHALADLAGRRLSALLAGSPDLWRLLAHGVVLGGLGTGASALWQRTMHRLESGTSADVPVVESGEVGKWTGATVSGGPGSLVPWSSLGREGRRHALTVVRPHPVPDRPPGVPDLSIETVMGEPPRATPVQVYVGLDSAGTARERVELALAEMERTGAFDRSLIMLVSPTGTGYVNYVAVAAAQYLTRGDVATVTLQYSKRPSPLSLGMVKPAREQNRLLWLRILERLRDRPGPRPRVVVFGESLGAHTSQDVFLHWGTLGPEALGIDRALWIGTPYGSEWMHQVTGPDRLDVDRDAVAVVNDFAQLEALGPQRRARLRYVLLSHDNDGVTKFGPDLLVTPPRWLGKDRPGREDVPGASPRGIPPGMRWRPLTTFFQLLIDMKNAQAPGTYRAWAHDYRADLPRFISEVYGLPATPEDLARIDAALRRREDVREELFAASAVATG